MTPRGIAVALALWSLAAPGAAECVRSDSVRPELLPVADSDTIMETSEDRSGRMVVPVMVDGAGPFRFIVDTGANRSAVSRQVADALGLATVGRGQVHSVHGVVDAPFVQVRSLEFGNLALGGAQLPMLQGPVLSGEQGLLGVDGLEGRRIRLDFEARCIEITQSGPIRRRAGWTLVRGDLRFGRLVVIEARMRGVPVSVFIDTGSDATLANVALRERLRSAVQVDEHRTAIARAYTAGMPIPLDTVLLIPRFSVGDVEIRNITAYVGDFHIFRLWDLVDQPALLIGMDVLSQARGLIIDYEEGAVLFRLHTPPTTGSRIRGADSSARARISR